MVGDVQRKRRSECVGSEPDTLYITVGLLGPTRENAGLFAKIAPN